MSATLISRLNPLGFHLLLGMALLLSSIAMLTPVTTPGPLPFPHADKVIHALTFLVLTGLIDYSWPQRGMVWQKWLPLVAYSSLMELGQTQVIGRQGDWLDWLANGSGILLYSLLIAGLLRRAKLR